MAEVPFSRGGGWFLRGAVDRSLSFERAREPSPPLAARLASEYDEELRERWYEQRRDLVFDAVTEMPRHVDRGALLALDPFFRGWWVRAPAGASVEKGDVYVPPGPDARALLEELAAERALRPVPPYRAERDLLRVAESDPLPTVRARALELLRVVDPPAAVALANDRVHRGSAAERVAAARVLDDPWRMIAALEADVVVYDHCDTAAVLARSRDRRIAEAAAAAIAPMHPSVLWAFFVFGACQEPLEAWFPELVLGAAEGHPELRDVIARGLAPFDGTDHDWPL
ncbi:MAG: hypothetical protein H6738_22955 [Alphaproteobacteria bacterium]|nr:hypothetical protein [Alphaproteobacteria bacterium]MCB9699663.1 hypothetical protein [Alphaproteobacteria bacterium]